MNVRLFALPLALAASLASPAALAESSDVKVYASGQLASGSYEVVRRFWVDSVRTIFYYPSYGSRDDALEAMKSSAASAGADGLIDVNCKQATVLMFEGDSFYCYGNAIKLKPGRAAPVLPKGVSG